MITLGYIAAFFVGFSLGLLGGGGSILAVPTLVYLFQVPATLATTYSLFVVGVTSLVGTYGYLRQQLVDVRVGGFFLAPSLLGVWLARQILLPALPDMILRTESFTLTKDRLILLVFAVVMALASYSMLGRKKNQDQSIHKATKPNLGKISLYGLMAGSLMGFVGAGGGFLIIPVLVTLGKMEMKPAIGTSLLIITLSTLFGSIGDFVSATNIDWFFLLSFSALSIGGVFIGAWVSKGVSSQHLKRGFGWMVLAISVLMLVKEIYFQ